MSMCFLELLLGLLFSKNLNDFLMRQCFHRVDGLKRVAILIAKVYSHKLFLRIQLIRISESRYANWFVFVDLFFEKIPLHSFLLFLFHFFHFFL